MHTVQFMHSTHYSVYVCAHTQLNTYLHAHMHVRTVPHEGSAYSCVHTKFTTMLTVYKLTAAECHGIGKVEKN